VNAARTNAGPLYPKLPPGPRGPRRESVASNQRARLYGAMIELVARRGYDASTVAELCNLAGVSKRTLYERFPGGKEECFLATYDIVVRRAESNILCASKREPNLNERAGRLQRMGAVVEAFATEVATHPNAARLVLVEAFHAGPSVLARLERTRQEAERVVPWSLGEDPRAPRPRPRIVKRIVADGTRLVRARLLDARDLGLLAAELLDFCCTAAAPLSSPDERVFAPYASPALRVSRNRNRSLQSNRPRVSVRDDVRL
jgi:AcrR family transcriptional regulator